MTRTAVFLTAALTALPAFAMGEGPVTLDSNADGMLSFTELQVAMPELTETTFAEIDANADGLLDAEEVAAAQEAGIIPATPGEG